MARTWLITAACSGAMGAAYLNSEWIAARRALRVALAFPPLLFEVMKELADERGVEVGEAELAGRLAGLGLGEGEQEPAAVAVGGDGVGAGLLLPGEPV